MRRKLFTDEQEAFFLSHQHGLSRQGIADLMRETFGINMTRQQVGEQRSRLNVTGGKVYIPQPSRRLLTPEQEEFFMENNRGLLRQQAADLMNKVFGLNLTALQIKELRRRLHPEVGKYKHTYKNSGQFQKGIPPHNHLPVGAEVVKDDGYLWRKIAEPNKWKQVHIIIWEAANGPRKPGEKIIFLNGDRMDIRLENLAKVSSAVNGIINRMHLRSNNPEATSTGINIAKLYEALHNRKKRSKDREQSNPTRL